MIYTRVGIKPKYKSHWITVLYITQHLKEYFVILIGMQNIKKYIIIIMIIAYLSQHIKK